MAHQYSAGEEPVTGSGYRLVEFLGRGGFGEVWKATAPGGAEAALKIIRLGGWEGRKEFRALQLVKRIRHPNLVPIIAFWLKGDDGSIFDDSVTVQGELPASEAAAVPRTTMQVPLQSSGVQAAELIIAMGLGDQSLMDRLKQCQAEGDEGIPQEELLGYVESAAEAIDFLNRPVHNLGSGPVAIQHCDIKPHNLMICGGAAQVCDFGLARSLAADRTNTAAASIAYAAPECLVEGKPSATTDQYSLAITYFELKTGRLPYRSETLSAIMDAKNDGNLDFSPLPDTEAAVLRRATCRAPQARYATAVEMVTALRRGAAGQASLDLPPPRSQLRPLMLAALVAAIGAAAFWAASLWRSTTAEVAQETRPPTKLETQTLPEPPANEKPEDSPEGKTMPQKPDVDPAVAALWRAEARVAQGQPELAIDDYTQAIDLRPNYGEARWGRGRCYLKTGQIDAAIADFQALDPAQFAVSADLADAYLTRGTRFLEQKDYPAAATDLEHAAQLKPTDARTFSRLAAAWFAQKKYEQAVAQVTRAIDLDPTDTDYYSRGRAYRELNQIPQAISDFSAAIQLNSHNAAAYAARGEAYLEQDDTPHSLADFDRAIELGGQPSAANFPLANAYLLRGSTRLIAGQLDQAAADFSEVLQRGTPELLGSIPSLLDSLAEQYAEAGKLAEAAKWIKKAIELESAEKPQQEYRTKLQRYEAERP